MKTLAFGAIAAALLSATAAQADHLDIPLDAVSFSGDTFTFPSVLIDKDGYVVIHAVTADGPVIPASIGHTMVKAGTSQNVEVMCE